MHLLRKAELKFGEKLERINMSLQEFKTSAYSDTGFARSNKYIVNVFLPNAKTAMGAGLIGTLFKNMPNTPFTQPGSSFVNIPGVFTGTQGVNIDVAQPLRNALSNKNFVNGVSKLGRPISGFVFQNIIGRGRQLTLYCSGAELPSRDVEATELYTYGESRQVGFRHMHQQLALQYYCSEDLRERRFFEEWQNMVYDPFSKNAGYYDEYTSTVQVQQWDYGLTRKMAEYVFDEAYVATIGNLAYEAGNAEIHRLSISFNYKSYRRTDSGSTGGLGDVVGNFAKKIAKGIGI